MSCNTYFAEYETNIDGGIDHYIEYQVLDFCALSYRFGSNKYIERMDLAKNIYDVEENCIFVSYRLNIIKKEILESYMLNFSIEHVVEEQEMVYNYLNKYWKDIEKNLLKNETDDSQKKEIIEFYEDVMSMLSININK